MDLTALGVFSPNVFGSLRSSEGGRCQEGLDLRLCVVCVLKEEEVILSVRGSPDRWSLGH